jgi:hypothetical protein
MPAKEYGFIICQLENDEYSTDAEMVDHLAAETGIAKDGLARLVADHRSRFMSEMIDMFEAVSIVDRYI